jgi:glutamate formiminotransferase/formiminotetrahydrofolate cyclodeaminase
VPNFSEGRDIQKIELIAEIIRKVKSVKLLHIDSNKDTNRTVITFAGNPDSVAEAAFQSVKKASEIIDMRIHHGVHPRFGATDVLPLIPVQAFSMDETVILARELAERIGNELNIPVFCYEFAAFTEKRKNLEWCRSGQYEGLEEKLKQPEWKPDFGPVLFNPKSGAIAVGARNFLIAYNVNLDTADISIARAIANEIRESGKSEQKQDEQGNIIKVQVPGSLKKVKAIGWYLPEYKKVQVSTNITDVNISPIHKVLEEIRKKARKHDVKVTGSELIGLIPLNVLLEAGNFYSGKPEEKNPEETKLKIAVDNLGLNELSPFDYKSRILEFVLGIE